MDRSEVSGYTDRHRTDDGLSDQHRLPNPYPPEEKALNAALAKAQGEFPAITRGKTVKTGAYSYTYAPLDVVLAAVRPALAKHGLSIVQRLEHPGGTGDAIRTELRHADGGVIAASFPIGERPANPQQLGSLLTYLRRYTLQAMLGIAPEDDDDGQQAVAAPKQAPARTPRNYPRSEIPAPTAKADPKPEPAEPVLPADIILTFGKFKDQTIGQVAETEGGRQYLHWVADKSTNERIKTAAAAFLADEDIPF